MKRLSLLLVACAFILSACEVLWPRDNPADPGAKNYAGYDTVTSPDEIAAMSPASGGTLTGTTLSVTKVIGATTYELRIASSAAALDSAPLYSKADFASNVMDISSSGIQDKTSYWWKARAAIVGKAGSWSAVYSLSTDFPPAEAPVFSPAGGAYKSDQSLALSSATTGSAIHYTTDGTDPTTGSTLYVAAFTVLGPGTKTIKAIATKACSKASTVGSATYVISYVSTAATPTPTFSPAGGTYTVDEGVTIVCTTDGARIFYTTDGSDPTTASTLYAGAIDIAGHGTTKTIKAIAKGPANAVSAVGTATYTITYPSAATPTFSPVGGSYTRDKSVTIESTTAGSIIYYTTDGTAPTTGSTLYSGAIGVPGNGMATTIKAIATATGFVASGVGSATYKVTQAATPTFSLVEGTYATAQSVTISSATTGGATICYTTDGSTPTTSSTHYATAITVPPNTPLTLSAIAISPTIYSSSAVATAAHGVTSAGSVAASASSAR